jgi:putative ABC transport system permease protein
MVIREAGRRIGLGLVLGLLAAVALSRFLEGLLFAIAPLDPLTFATVPLCLGAIAAAATLVPALRASRVDPMTALRCE